MFRSYRGIIRPYYKNRFIHFQYILGSQTVYKSHHHINFVNSLGSQNVLEVNEPVLIVRPDDGPIGPKLVALFVLLMVIIDVLD